LAKENDIHRGRYGYPPRGDGEILYTLAQGGVKILSDRYFMKKGGKLIFKICASPSASRTETKGLRSGALRLRVAAPPEKGKANKAIEDFVSEILDCPKSSVEIVSGLTSRMKTIAVPLDRENALEKLFAESEVENHE
jgi:uncharacterized protein (TIGR00251 family)